MSEGFVLLDPSFRVLEMNTEGERIEGRPAGEIVGKSIWDSWPELENHELGHLWRRAVAEDVPVELEHLYTTPDGRDVWLEMRAYPSNGCLAIFYRDISVRKGAEAALMETKRRLDAVLGNATVAIILMDERQHCSYMNQAAERLTGFTLEEVSGRALHDAVHHKRSDGSSYPIEECPIDRAFPENMRQQGEELFVHKDGHFYPVAYTASPIRDESSKTIGTIIEVRDIRQEKEAEAALQRTQSELVHLSRVNAMGTMASTLAHELNQPLTAVTNYIRGSKRLLTAGEDMRRVLDGLDWAEAEAHRAGEIVRRLRSFVSTGTINAQPQRLPLLIEQACVLGLVDAHLRGVTHRFDLDPAAEWVSADGVQVQQVVINLVRNAMEAMETSQRRHIEISTRRTGGDMVEVSISDTGPGVPEDVRSALFSPFHSTKEHGVGVGLSICRTIVEAHNGMISVDDAAGGGAVFRFTLPVEEPQKDNGADVHTPAPLPEQGEGSLQPQLPYSGRKSATER